MEVLAPSSAAWVRAECRSWCKVQPPVASSKTSAARRYERRAWPLTGSRSLAGRATRARRSVTNTGPAFLPCSRRGRSRAVPVCHTMMSRRPSLAPDPGLVGAQVQIRNVEGEDLADASGGLVEDAPQRLVPQGHVAPGQQCLHLGSGQGPRPVGRALAPAEALGGVGLEPPLVGPVAAGRSQGVEVAVPGSGRPLPPPPLEPGADLRTRQRGGRTARGVSAPSWTTKARSVPA